MPNTKSCLSCNKSLATKYANALTCGSTCRGRIFRANKQATVPVKLAFTVQHFAAINNAAGHHGVTVAEYIMSRVTESDTHLAMTISC